MPGYPCCCEDCPCEQCTGATPGQIQLTIAGVVDDSDDCCDGINGTYVLDQSQAFCCRYQFTLPTPVCTLKYIILNLNASNIVATFNWSASVYGAFSKSTTLTYDCEFSGLVLPFSGHAPGPQGCDYSGATVTITSL